MKSNTKMKKVILGIVLTIISITGLGLNNSFADQYIYEYRELGNDMVMKLTYEETDMRLVEVEIVHEDN